MLDLKNLLKASNKNTPQWKGLNPTPETPMMIQNSQTE
ncbi:hypothetical protein R80B4_01789 [Fibrobacteres bacterium R8-0-B4]